MRTPGSVVQTAADTGLPPATLVPTARSPPPRPPIQSTTAQGTAPRNLQAASNTHLHEAPAGSTALGPAPSGPVVSFFRPAFPLPSKAEVTAERCDWAAWRRGSGCLCCQKAEASHPGFWRPNSLPSLPLAVPVCRCHLPAFCDGAELRTAARMGPPERRERRAKPGGEGGAVGCSGWEASDWPVGLGFGARTQGRFGRGALEPHRSGCWNAVWRIALRVAAQVESNPPCRLSRLWADAKSRMLSCPGTPQSLE